MIMRKHCVVDKKTAIDKQWRFIKVYIELVSFYMLYISLMIKLTTHSTPPE